jgi:hypothetical protein
MEVTGSADSKDGVVQSSSKFRNSLDGVLSYRLQCSLDGVIQSSSKSRNSLDGV